MRLLGFGGDFSNKDREDDLPLTSIRHTGPLFHRVHAGKGFEGDILAEHTGKVDSGGLDDEPGGGQHGGTAVLQLGGLEPGKGLLAADLCQAEGVEPFQRSRATRKVIERYTGNGGGSLWMIQRRTMLEGRGTEKEAVGAGEHHP